VVLITMSATKTQLLSSGEFCKLHYDTILTYLLHGAESLLRS